MQLHTSLSGRESPIDRRFGSIALCFICVDFAFERLIVRDTTIQTWPAQHTQLYFSHIEPTAMFRCVVKLQSPEHASGLCGLKRLVQRSRFVGIEMVQHHTDDLCRGISLIDQPLHLVPKIRHGALGRHCNVPPASLRFADDKEVAGAMALVFVVVALWLAWLRWQGGARLGDLTSCEF
jgi:hypothetical protein